MEKSKWKFMVSCPNIFFCIFRKGGRDANCGVEYAKGQQPQVDGAVGNDICGFGIGKRRDVF